MPRAGLPILILLLLASSCVGCRFMETASWSSYVSMFGPDMVDAPGPAVSAELLAISLNQDNWQLNPQWSPVLEARSRVESVPAVHQLRWYRAVRVADSAQPELPAIPAAIEAPQAEKTSEEPAPAAPPPWAGPATKEAKKNSSDPAEILTQLNKLAKRNDLVGWNAAILWAQQSPEMDDLIARKLQRLVFGGHSVERPAADSKNDDKTKSTETPLNPADLPNVRLRSAAAEAWCLLLSKSETEPAVAMKPALEALTRPQLIDEIRVELFRGLARRIPPREIPWLTDALASRGREEAAPTVYRLAAIDACLIFVLSDPAQHASSEAKAENTSSRGKPAADTPWPESVSNLRWDESAAVRIRFGQFLALTQHADALTILQEQTLDRDFSVRNAALVTLGELGTSDAKAVLTRFAARSEDPIRAAALRGLSAWGPAEVGKWVDDPAQVVRIQVVKELGKHHNATSSALMRDLLSDSDLQIQLEAIKSIEPWPNDLAVPLLLHALRDGALKTRQLGLQQLEQRRGDTIGFPLAEERELRVAESGRLARNWGLPSDVSQRLERVTLFDQLRGNEMRVAEIQEHLQQIEPGRPQTEIARHIDWLKQLTAADVPALEKALDEGTPFQVSILTQDVLPQISPGYEVLRQLEQSDPIRRQRAAMNLLREAELATLSPQLVRQLRNRMVHEQDRLVWRYVMGAILTDNSTETAEIALLALNHLWPDIRVLGCEHIARHGHPEHANWLLPLFRDTNSNVQISAIRAAAQCHNPIVLDGPAGSQGGGLRPLLTSHVVPLRLAAAVCMSQFGDESALRELVRLSLDENWSIRRDAVEGMGTSGQTRFVEQLIRVAWTEPHHTVRHVALASLNRLVPAQDRPPSSQNVNNLDDLVESWAEWWESRKRQTGFTTSTAPVLNSAFGNGIPRSDVNADRSGIPMQSR